MHRVQYSAASGCGAAARLGVPATRHCQRDAPKTAPARKNLASDVIFNSLLKWILMVGKLASINIQLIKYYINIFWKYGRHLVSICEFTLPNSQHLHNYLNKRCQSSTITISFKAETEKCKRTVCEQYVCDIQKTNDHKLKSSFCPKCGTCR
jgi:hypothetical protein